MGYDNTFREATASIHENVATETLKKRNALAVTHAREDEERERAEALAKSTQRTRHLAELAALKDAHRRQHDDLKTATDRSRFDMREQHKREVTELTAQGKDALATAIRCFIDWRDGDAAQIQQFSQATARDAQRPGEESAPPEPASRGETALRAPGDRQGEEDPERSSLPEVRRGGPEEPFLGHLIR